MLEAKRVRLACHIICTVNVVARKHGRHVLDRATVFSRAVSHLQQQHAIRDIFEAKWYRYKTTFIAIPQGNGIDAFAPVKRLDDVPELSRTLKPEGTEELRCAYKCVHVKGVCFADSPVDTMEETSEQLNDGTSRGLRASQASTRRWIG